jgi:hypothetical protein
MIGLRREFNFFILKVKNFCLNKKPSVTKAKPKNY